MIGRPKAPKIARGHARPAPERAREVGGVGVAQVQGDIDDLPVRVVEHALRRIEARLRDHPRVGQALLLQLALERPDARSNCLGEDMNVGVAVRERASAAVGGRAMPERR